MFLKKNVQKRYEAINIDVPFLLLFTALYATCTQKRLKRHEAKVGQSVANSSKNGKLLFGEKTKGESLGEEWACDRAGSEAGGLVLRL